MTMSIAFFNCPHCVDSFAFDFQKLKSLTLHSRVRVRCPGCQNAVEVVEVVTMAKELLVI